VRQARSNADGFTQSNRTAAADRHHAVGVCLLCVGEGFVGNVGRCVHCCFSEDTCDAAIEDGFELLHSLDLLRRTEEQWGREVQARDFGGEFLYTSATENDAAGVGVVFERLHCAVSGDKNKGDE